MARTRSCEALLVASPLAFRAVVPQVPVEPEEAGRPGGPVGVADEELDVEVADDLHTAGVQLPVEVLEPGPELVQPANREVRRVAVVLRRVPEAPKVAAVEADLCDLRPRVLDELEVARVRVLVPVGDEPRELQARRVRRAARRGGESQEANGQDRAARPGTGRRWGVGTHPADLAAGRVSGHAERDIAAGPPGSDDDERQSIEQRRPGQPPGPRPPAGHGRSSPLLDATWLNAILERPFCRLCRNWFRPE